MPFENEIDTLERVSAQSGICGILFFYDIWKLGIGFIIIRHIGH